jgi:hypothetical protein
MVLLIYFIFCKKFTQTICLIYLLIHFLQGGKKYNTEVSGEWTPIWYHHDDRGSKVFEKFCKYNINGIHGYGLVEFHYRLANKF